jgi:uncharacterized protein YqeY
MNLEEKVMAAMKTAMKEKDSVSLSALRAIKSAIMRFKTDQPGADFTAEEELKLLTKIKKQLSDSIEVYTQQNRPDLADEEKAQLAVIEQFLPQPLSEAELEAALREIIAETGASAPSDMGKVMGIASSRFMGRADGKTISGIVRKLLSN